MNEYLATVPFDIYQLSLFNLVVEHGSFTRAAEISGLTQSAITRQIQNMESKLNLELLERTTRAVKPTDAGSFLYRESQSLLGDVNSTLQRLREDYAEGSKLIRVGISRTIGMAYFPGFFFSNQRNLSNVEYEVSHTPSAEILTDLESNDLDVGIICPPKQLPSAIKVSHRFSDSFTIICASDLSAPKLTGQKPDAVKLGAWLRNQPWIVLNDQSNTGQLLHNWLKSEKLNASVIMQLDQFDLIVNLVALGMGVSIVPTRSLAGYVRRRNLQRIALPKSISRKLVVVTRKHRKIPEHIQQFVDNILF